MLGKRQLTLQPSTKHCHQPSANGHSLQAQLGTAGWEYLHGVPTKLRNFLAINCRGARL